MRKFFIIALCGILISACCDPTKTYDSFSKEQLQLLYYLEGQEIIYESNKSDSIHLRVSDYFIGNIAPKSVETIECDTYYPAYGRATVEAPSDTAIKFEFIIRKSDDLDGVSEEVRFMGYSFLLNDTSQATFYDSILLRGSSTFYKVYELAIEDTVGERRDLINKVYFNTDYGIIRFDQADGTTYRLRIP